MAAMTGKATREALEPFVRMINALDAIRAGKPGEEAPKDDRTFSVTWGPKGSEKAAAITYGDLRRARTAYDSIGAGVKALDGNDVWEMLFGVIHVRAHDISEAECAKIASLLSIHAAAGAGPVDEAVALWAEPDWRETLAKEGDLIVYPKKAQDWFVSVTTRPIDKPGLVERLTSERDAARAERDRALYFFHHRDFRDVGLPHPNDGMRHCTGINLDRLAAAKRLRDVGLVTIEDSPSGPMVAWASGRGAALKGDAQEGGK